MQTPTPADPQVLLRQAYDAFAADKLDLARRQLRSLCQAFPDAAPVLHLLALVEKKAGRAGDATRAFEAALRVAPRDHEILTNFGNLLAATGAHEAAAKRYQEALLARPGHFEALIGLALALQDAERLEEAMQFAEAATAARPRSARAWSVLGLIQKAAGDREAAWHSLSHALRIEPAHLRALHGCAQIELERGNEAAALAAFMFARRTGPDDQELRLGEAIARYETGEPHAAIQSLEEALKMRPDWVKGHRALAEMRWQQGDHANYVRSLETALRARPRDPALWTARLATLANAGEVGRALELIPQARKALGRSETLDLLEASLASQTGEDARADMAFDRLAKVSTRSALIALTRHRIRQKRPDAAQKLATQITRDMPQDQMGWALLGTAWRMNGDPRAQWLYDVAGAIGAIDIDRSVTDAAADRLRERHRSISPPLDQSLRGGTQTSGDLFALAFPEIVALKEAVLSALQDHLSMLPKGDPLHPLLRRMAAPRLAGSWSVRLQGSGFHINHVHPQGWLSSACYIALPPSDPERPRAGWLKLGEPPEDLRTDLPPLGWIEPAPGRLALFPAYLWHGTAPFEVGERLTVAFDVVPASN